MAVEGFKPTSKERTSIIVEGFWNLSGAIYHLDQPWYMISIYIYIHIYIYIYIFVGEYKFAFYASALLGSKSSWDLRSNTRWSQAKKMIALKAKDKGAADVACESGDVLSKFRDYDLDKLGLPHSARPLANQVYTGKHGYTLRSTKGGVPLIEQLSTLLSSTRQSLKFFDLILRHIYTNIYIIVHISYIHTSTRERRLVVAKAQAVLVKSWRSMTSTLEISMAMQRMSFLQESNGKLINWIINRWSYDNGFIRWILIQ